MKQPKKEAILVSKLKESKEKGIKGWSLLKELERRKQRGQTSE